MKLNKNLLDLTLDDLHISKKMDGYKVEINPNSTVASLVYEHLNSKPGLIRHIRSAPISKELEDSYSKVLHKIVSKGAPFEIFITAFSPKVTNPATSNNYLHPDMGDLLTLIHLHSVAKEIREVYDYGFRFIVGLRGNLYKDFFNWSKSELDIFSSRIEKLRIAAENITGARNAVRFVDMTDLIEQEGKTFKDKWEEEICFVTKEYKNKNEFYSRKINSWIRDFKKSIDIKQFPNPISLEEHLLKYAIYFRALKNIQFSGGENDLGICNSFPNVLKANVRGLDNKITFQLNPFFRFQSYQRLLILKKDNSWETIKWDDMTNFEPVYINDFKTPFYFIEK